MAKPPAVFTKFMEEFPEVGEAYNALGKAVREAGPLDEKTIALIKLAIAVGARLEGAVHSHARRAREAGWSREALRQTAMLSVTTIGFSSMMAALVWVEDVLGKEKGRRGRGRAAEGRRSR